LNSPDPQKAIEIFFSQNLQAYSRDFTCFTVISGSQISLLQSSQATKTPLKVVPQWEQYHVFWSSSRLCPMTSSLCSPHFGHFKFITFLTLPFLKKQSIASPATGRFSQKKDGTCYRLK